jgi:protein-L-isoaspartate(D-aspartate) O-methyltransferase
MKTDLVLELGTGSSYQAAILSRLVPQGRVLTLERLPRLARTARDRLRGLRYDNVDVKVATETLGCPEEAPFNAILVTAAAPRLPEALVGQLTPGGRMIIPVGHLQEQDLLKVLRTDEGHSVTQLGPCRFVPLIGDDAWTEEGSS